MNNKEQVLAGYEKIVRSNRTATLKSILLFLVLTGVSIGALFLFLDEKSEIVTFSMLAIFMFGALAGGTRGMFHKDVTRYVMDNVYLPMYKNEFSDVVVSSSGFSQGQLLKSKMVTNGNSFESNTFIQLKTENFRVKMSNASLVNRNSKNEVSTVSFHGRWYIFDRLGITSPYVQVHSDKSDAKINAMTYDLQSVETESIEFNNVFVTLSENELDAFKVLQPHIMEVLLGLKNELGEQAKLMLALRDDKLYIGVKDDGDFALLKSEKINDSYITSIENDIVKTKQIIDHLTKILKMDN